jgi:hypothetical protein
MFLQVQAVRPSLRNALSRVTEWWPAALVGIAALLSSLPDANAQTLLRL